MRARNLPFVILAVLILALLPLWSSSPPQVRAQASLTITMGDLFFRPNSFPVAPNESVSLTLINSGAGPHTFTLFDDVDADVPRAPTALEDYYNTHVKIVDLNFTTGQQRSATFTAPSTEGTYTFVCMVSGHAQAGMVGTMRVTSGPAPGIDPLLLGIVIAIVVIVIAVATVFLLRRRA